MKAMQRCPDCRQVLDSDDECCCGWKAFNKYEVVNHQCVYVYSERRCPFDEANCLSLYGSGPWHCLEQYRNLRDPKRGVKILMDVEENFEAILSELGLVTFPF